MGGRHLSLPSPTYRNPLGWDCTLYVRLDDGWSPAPVWYPAEFPGG